MFSRALSTARLSFGSARIAKRACKQYQYASVHQASSWSWQLGEPVYALSYNERRYQIMAGMQNKVCVFTMLPAQEEKSNYEIMDPNWVSNDTHTDMVRCLVSCEGRFYSAGCDAHAEQSLIRLDLIRNWSCTIRTCPTWERSRCECCKSSRTRMKLPSPAWSTARIMTTAGSSRAGTIEL